MVPSSDRLRLMNEATARAVEARSSVSNARTLAIRTDGKVGVGMTGIGGTIDTVPTKTPSPAKTYAAENADAAEVDSTPPADEYVRMLDERARTIVELAMLKRRLGRVPQSVMAEATRRLSMSS
jgi:hypothetical protein